MALSSGKLEPLYHQLSSMGKLYVCLALGTFSCKKLLRQVQLSKRARFPSTLEKKKCYICRFSVLVTSGFFYLFNTKIRYKNF